MIIKLTYKNFFLVLIALILPIEVLIADIKAEETTDFKGWSYLANVLIDSGIDRDIIVEIFSSSKMPRFEKISFKMKPREPSDIYRVFYDQQRINVALDCLSKHDEAFTGAEKQLEVSRYVIAAILLVETQCGRYTGKHPVFIRPARLASIPAPENVLWNHEQLKKEYMAEGKELTLEDVSNRAHAIQEIFLPQLKAYFDTIKKKQIKPLELQGSIAGAFGIPQFLPGSYMQFAIDGDGDGDIDLFKHSDAVYSAANYLKVHGWSDDLPVEEKRRVIWTYNRSDPYITTVLEVAELLRNKEKKKKQI